MYSTPFVMKMKDWVNMNIDKMDIGILLKKS